MEALRRYIDFESLDQALLPPLPPSGSSERHIEHHEVRSEDDEATECTRESD